MSDTDELPCPTPGTDDATPETADPVLRVVDSSLIFGADTEVLIRHEGELYRIRITRRGRLILQK